MMYIVLPLLLYIAYKEVRTRRMPKEALTVGYVLSAVYILYLLYSRQSVIGSLLGLVFGLGFPYLVRVISRGGIGLDDVLLWGALGALLGLQRFGSMLAVALIIVSVYSIVMICRKVYTLKSAIVFTPFLTVAGVILGVVEKKLI
ncbi:leader peptidase (prepilin peptidase) / N-methyltransferase [Caldanaerobius fijiensis DSM 17918]|uniref:Leader peptidase (Prepilin peptidase) / N-methyltransferase n=1 Tax=Caldanaerobius fijiensis DSM 17918 TaxID=1121256 RepID=A0A1M5CKS2_9THEO|nr:prepilin peptidase [Caldanaerobius fijiensis]SHF55308.1 leader peptidase (prepilin peptidase) / N-methyltransferase [Caldanaerobius fijiensis DSM 17918]